MLKQYVHTNQYPCDGPDAFTQLFLWLTSWPVHLNKLFAEPPQRFGTASDMATNPTPLVSPSHPLQPPPTQSSLPTHPVDQVLPSHPSPPSAQPGGAGASTAVNTFTHALRLEELVQTDASILLRNMPHDMVASAAVAEKLIEDVSRRDISMRHPHVLNNLAMAGVVTSFFINVSVNRPIGLYCYL